MMKAALKGTKTMSVQYHWATIGTGVIGHQLAEAMIAEGGSLYAVANRTHAKGVAFAQQYNIPIVYDEIDDVFHDPNVDIIYISTPHNTHIQYLRKALAAGKHVLCEKAITLNSSELDEAIRLADAHHVVLAEAMTIYHMPLYRKLHEIISSGALGPLRLVQMNFGSYKEYDMNNRFFNRNLAGGAMLDIGVYALSFTRWFMTSSPDQILTQYKPAPTGVDEQASILLMNREQEMASIILSLHAKQPKRGTVSFDKGYIEVYEYPRADRAVITWTEDGHQDVITAGHTADALRYEVTDMEKAVNGDRSRIHLDYTKDVMDIMTYCRNQWGLKYPEEEQ
jgi:predicted dehydrogenase